MYLELQKKYRTLLKNAQINTPLRLAHFWSQLEYESNLKPIAENLNYGAQALRATFPKYFKDLKHAQEYHRQPEKIANYVYANRMGNGNTESGEGWKYRGRGFLQITGKANYEAVQKDTKIKCVDNPDLLLEEVNAMVSAVWFWTKNNLNELADKDYQNGITKVINGGQNGREGRALFLLNYKKIYGIK